MALTKFSREQEKVLFFFRWTSISWAICLCGRAVLPTQAFQAGEWS